MFKELKMERMSENEINELPINDMPMVALLIKARRWKKFPRGATPNCTWATLEWTKLPVKKFLWGRQSHTKFFIWA